MNRIHPNFLAFIYAFATITVIFLFKFMEYGGDWGIVFIILTALSTPIIGLPIFFKGFHFSFKDLLPAFFYVSLTFLFLKILNKINWFYQNIVYLWPFIPNIVLWVPLYEELFFRWVFPNAFQKLWNHKTENKEFSFLFLNALFFWICHAPGQILPWQRALSQGHIPLSNGTFILGLACQWLTNTHGSIWPAVLLHGAANGLGFAWSPILGVWWSELLGL